MHLYELKLLYRTDIAQFNFLLPYDYFQYQVVHNMHVNIACRLIVLFSTKMNECYCTLHGFVHSCTPIKGFATQMRYFYI